MTGTVLGDRYELIRRLGEGSTGIVYQVRDRELGDVCCVTRLEKPSTQGSRHRPGRQPQGTAAVAAAQPEVTAHE